MFEAYVVVDWSANSRPKMGKDSIWIAEAGRLGRRVRVEAPINLPTRAAAMSATERPSSGLRAGDCASCTVMRAQLPKAIGCSSSLRNWLRNAGSA